MPPKTRQADDAMELVIKLYRELEKISTTGGRSADEIYRDIRKIEEQAIEGIAEDEKTAKERENLVIELQQKSSLEIRQAVMKYEQCTSELDLSHQEEENAYNILQLKLISEGISGTSTELKTVTGSGKKLDKMVKSFVDEKGMDTKEVVEHGKVNKNILVNEKARNLKFSKFTKSKRK